MFGGIVTWYIQRRRRARRSPAAWHVWIPGIIYEMARSTGTLKHMLWRRNSIVLDSLHLVGRGGEGKWLLQLVAHVQTQFQVLNKKRLHCLTLEYQIARHRQTFCMCCRGWWVGKPPSMIAFPLPRIVGQARPVSSSTCNNGKRCDFRKSQFTSPPWHLSVGVQLYLPEPFLPQDPPE